MSDYSSNLPANDLISVGRILGAHGRGGEIRVRPASDVLGRFDEGRTLMLSKDGVVPEGRTYQISESRPTVSKGSVELIIAFEDLFDRDLAIRLTGYWLCVTESEVPVTEEGEYFHYQLIGLQVKTVDGEDLGELAEILETGANDVYVITDGEKNLLVPALRTVVREIDVDTGLMVVDLPEGLR